MKNFYELRNVEDDAKKIGLDEELIKFSLDFNNLYAKIFYSLNIENPSFGNLRNIAMEKNIDIKVISYSDRTFGRCLNSFEHYINQFKLDNLKEELNNVRAKMRELKLEDKRYYSKNICDDEFEKKLISYNEMLLLAISNVR